MAKARRKPGIDAVRGYLLSHGWVTLAEVAKATKFPEASVSARIRDLRKLAYGGYMIERRQLHGRLCQYRLGAALFVPAQLAHGKDRAAHAGTSE